MPKEQEEKKRPVLPRMTQEARAKVGAAMLYSVKRSPLGIALSLLGPSPAGEGSDVVPKGEKVGMARVKNLAEQAKLKAFRAQKAEKKAAKADQKATKKAVSQVRKKAYKGENTSLLGHLSARGRKQTPTQQAILAETDKVISNDATLNYMFNRGFAFGLPKKRQ
jgi:hypothetical protein